MIVGRRINTAQSTPNAAEASGRHAWLRAGLAAAPIVALLVALYWNVLRVQLEDCSEDPNYSHAFLVPIFSGFLIWQRRKALGSLTVQGSWIGLPLILAGAGALLLGDLAGETFLMRTSFIVVLAGLILFHLGRPTFRTLAFPLFFLLVAKVELAKNSILRHRTDGALVRVSSPIYGNVRDTSDLLVRYVQALYPVLGDYLPS